MTDELDLFDDFEELKIEGRTKPFELPWFQRFADDAHLVVVCAGDANPKYTEAMLAQGSHRARAVVAKGSISKKDAEADRDEDRELFALYVVVGWHGVKNKKGEDVPFTQEACKEFLRKMPGWIFDKLRQFCFRPERFIENLPGSAADLAKN